MVMNLGFLGVFKYSNFFIDSFAALVRQLGNRTVVGNAAYYPARGYFILHLPEHVIYHRRVAKGVKMGTFVAEICHVYRSFPQLVAGPLCARPIFYIR